MTSGIRAMTGERHSDMMKLNRISSVIIIASVDICGSRAKRKAHSGRPTMIQGMRRPKRVSLRSLRMPTVGWKMTPKTLSMVIMMPISVVDRPKRPSSITGTSEL